MMGNKMASLLQNCEVGDDGYDNDCVYFTR